MFDKMLNYMRPVDKDVKHMMKYHGDQFKVYQLVQMHMKKTENVLDIACGTGLGTVYLSQGCKKIYGYDMDFDSIVYANKYNWSENVQYIMSDCCNLKAFNAEEFDLVVSFETIEHLDIEQRKLYLKELHRVVKKTGKVLISTPYNGMNKKLHPNPIVRSVYDHKIEFTFNELKAELEHYFEIVEYGGIYHKKNVMCEYDEIFSAEPPNKTWQYLKDNLSRLIPEKIKDIVQDWKGNYFDIANYVYVTGKLIHSNTMFLELRRR